MTRVVMKVIYKIHVAIPKILFFLRRKISVLFKDKNRVYTKAVTKKSMKIKNLELKYILQIS